jgi:hypothetical protein
LAQVYTPPLSAALLSVRESHEVIPVVIVNEVGIVIFSAGLRVIVLRLVKNLLLVAFILHLPATAASGDVGSSSKLRVTPVIGVPLVVPSSVL